MRRVSIRMLGPCTESAAELGGAAQSVRVLSALHGALVCTAVVGACTAACVWAEPVPMEFAYTGMASRTVYDWTLDEVTGLPVYSEYSSTPLRAVEARYHVTLEEQEPGHWTGTFEDLYLLWGDGSVQHYDLVAMISGCPSSQDHVDLTALADGSVIMDDGLATQSQVSGWNARFYSPPISYPPGYPSGTAEQWGRGIWFLTEYFSFAFDYYIVWGGDPISYRLHENGTALGVGGRITYLGSRRPLPECPQPVPEPTTLALLGLGIGVVTGLRRR